MSRENVELVHRAADAFNRRDLDAALVLMDDDVEVIPRAVAMEGGDHYHGHDGVGRWWKDLFGVFPDYAVEIVEVRRSRRLLRLRDTRICSRTTTELPPEAGVAVYVRGIAPVRLSQPWKGE